MADDTTQTEGEATGVVTEDAAQTPEPTPAPEPAPESNVGQDDPDAALKAAGFRLVRGAWRR